MRHEHTVSFSGFVYNQQTEATRNRYKRSINRGLRSENSHFLKILLSMKKKIKILHNIGAQMVGSKDSELGLKQSQKL